MVSRKPGPFPLHETSAQVHLERDGEILRIEVVPVGYNNGSDIKQVTFDRGWLYRGLHESHFMGLHNLSDTNVLGYAGRIVAGSSALELHVDVYVDGSSKEDPRSHTQGISALLRYRGRRLETVQREARSPSVSMLPDDIETADGKELQPQNSSYATKASKSSRF